MIVQLTVDDGNDNSFIWRVDKSPFLIGRDGECNGVLDCRTVSRRHCVLKIKTQGLTIKDLGSRNGTKVNEVRLAVGQRAVLNSGDHIQIGRFKLTVGDLGSVPINPSSVNRESAYSASAPSEPAFSDAKASARSATKISLLAELDDLAAQIFDSKEPKSLPSSRELAKRRLPADALGQTASGHTSVPHSAGSGMDKKDLPQSSTNATSSLDTSRLTESKHGDSPASSASLSDDLSPSGTLDSSTVVFEMSSDTATTEELVDQPVNVLKEHLESLKAKDSREAAERALKNLFRGR